SIDHLVPPHIALDIYQCYNQKSLTTNPTTTETTPQIQTITTTESPMKEMLPE
ncbi:MAG TPA: pantetheine-phosphate adenylyltransferase, partial [Nostocaceae cyanobacterium]|nr:pantetheine-phosphate adenylyltransferase [Nostocaceae cyanobacterium]